MLHAKKKKKDEILPTFTEFGNYFKNITLSIIFLIALDFVTVYKSE